MTGNARASESLRELANLKLIQKGGQVVDNEKPVLRVKCYRVAF